jgi:PTH1 family peptidyl-tRNA hydrolase
MNKFLLVGLGNPGNEYAHTRHNIGFDVLQAFVSKHNGQFAVDRLAYQAQVNWKGKQFVCICPTTYMNLSGRAFKFWLEKTKVPLEQTLTVLDDLALPIDKIRLRPSGTYAGHNGLRDIEAILGTDVYPKLRFGIGNQFPKGMQAEFVLSQWKPDELATIQLKVEKSVEIIENWATIGIERTMSLYNNQQFRAVQ